MGEWILGPFAHMNHKKNFFLTTMEQYSYSSNCTSKTTEEFGVWYLALEKPPKFASGLVDTFKYYYDMETSVSILDAILRFQYDNDTNEII